MRTQCSTSTTPISDFPPRVKVGHPRPINNQSNQFPHKMNNMPNSLSIRSPGAADRASATRMLDPTAHSGRTGRKATWQKNNELASHIFNFNARSRSHVTLVTNRAQKVRAGHEVGVNKVSNFFQLNRPRHAHIKRKARYNHKRYG